MIRPILLEIYLWDGKLSSGCLDRVLRRHHCLVDHGLPFFLRHLLPTSNWVNPLLKLILINNSLQCFNLQLKFYLKLLEIFDWSTAHGNRNVVPKFQLAIISDLDGQIFFGLLSTRHISGILFDSALIDGWVAFFLLISLFDYKLRIKLQSISDQLISMNQILAIFISDHVIMNIRKNYSALLWWDEGYLSRLALIANFLRLSWGYWLIMILLFSHMIQPLLIFFVPIII